MNAKNLLKTLQHYIELDSDLSYEARSELNSDVEALGEMIDSQESRLRALEASVSRLVQGEMPCA